MPTQPSDDRAVSPPADPDITQIHPNQLLMQQSRLLTQLNQQVTETNRHLNSIRNWVTFLGVVVALALIGAAIVIADAMGQT
jgi:hypothetical protein